MTVQEQAVYLRLSNEDSDFMEKDIHTINRFNGCDLSLLSPNRILPMTHGHLWLRVIVIPFAWRPIVNCISCIRSLLTLSILQLFLIENKEDITLSAVAIFCQLSEDPWRSRIIWRSKSVQASAAATGTRSSISLLKTCDLRSVSLTFVRTSFNHYAGTFKHYA